MKHCIRCNTTKELTGFSKDRSRSDGYHTYCKACNSEIKKAHAKANKEKIQKYQKEYKEKNKTRLSIYHKNYLENGGREVRKEYREKNRDKIKQLKNNNETKRKRVKTESNLSGTEYSDWVNDQFKVCSYCGKDCTHNFHVDHIDPLNKSGTHTLDNLTISCASCNTSKGQKSLLEFVIYKKVTSGTEPTEI